MDSVTASRHFQLDRAGGGFCALIIRAEVTSPLAGIDRLRGSSRDERGPGRADNSRSPRAATQKHKKLSHSTVIPSAAEVGPAEY